MCCRCLPLCLLFLSLNAGPRGGVEVGLAREALGVGGAANTDAFHAKWQALPQQDDAPAVSIGVLGSAHGGDSTSDFYVVGTKIIPATTPAIISANVRSTNGIGFGLLGRADREIEMGGFLGFLVNPQVIVGWEAAEQPGGASTWSAFCVRYSPSADTNFDVGLADLGAGLSDQIVVVCTHRF